MKAFILIAVSMVACASAGHLGYGRGGVSTGTSSQFRSEDNYGNYQFGYDESHSTGATSRREEQSNGIRRGSYSLSDADGRQRTVHYVADAHGFRASIHTNEPGVEPKDPADVLINKEARAELVAAPVYAAPAPVAVAAPAHAQVYSAPAPLALPAPAPLALPAPASYGPKPIVALRQALPAGPSYGAGPILAAPAPVYGDAPVVEAPAPRAFSYSFDSTHVSPVAARSYSAPAPVYQQGPSY